MKGSSVGVKPAPPFASDLLLCINHLPRTAAGPSFSCIVRHTPQASLNQTRAHLRASPPVAASSSVSQSSSASCVIRTPLCFPSTPRLDGSCAGRGNSLPAGICARRTAGHRRCQNPAETGAAHRSAPEPCSGSRTRSPHWRASSMRSVRWRTARATFGTAATSGSSQGSPTHFFLQGCRGSGVPAYRRHSQLPRHHQQDGDDRLPHARRDLAAGRLISPKVQLVA